MTGDLFIPPGLIMILGAWLLPFLGRRVQAWSVLVLSSLSLLAFGLTAADSYGQIEWLGIELVVARVDSLSRIFGVIFHLAAILSAIYALHVRDARQHVAALVYAGAAIGACCAGDLVTLFVYWELTALSSVFLIWASDNERAYRSGMRYLIIQVGSGVLLLSGIIVRYVATGSVEFVRFTPEGGAMDAAAMLILLAFGIKCAFPLLHNWLQDAYPEATPSGTVYLSGFTTKLAVYALARGFPGTELLIWVGCAMTLFPIVYAVIENDLRRVLAYSLNNQLGFMVVGIGIGTELAINGTAAHAFCHIIYKALLFMSMGAVLYRVGTVKATELGGLHKSMPWTTGFCMVGAGAISGFPLLSGFVSKSMILSAAGEQHLFWVWIVLLIASAGVMEHSGIKIPFFAFFAHDSGKRPKEAPPHMLVAMALAAGLCVLLGVAYPLLYRWLPYPADYHPYTAAHVVTQLQLLLFAALAFVFLMKTGLYPAEQRATNLDTDWVYRRAFPMLIHGGSVVFGGLDRGLRRAALGSLQAFLRGVRTLFSEHGLFGRAWSTGIMTFWATILLAFCLLLYYL
ncbi:Na(+)/H(+) antiporter subunit D [Roseimaritima sediminicola]|uniref:Na(+)/H(+) antiporter subunit D n=1 Tax=Roseimaritima sediminicola TaxID=2662066 RepID=UPI00129837E9|nr:Na(+)/H(+) antiporter subunit D [Roseimaritima sediminicola]